MKWDKITKLTFKRFLFAVLLIIVAAALRVWPLGILESKVVWVTFYPAVMVVALYSGILGGVLATAFACVVVVYFWQIIVVVPFIQSNADWLSMAVFIFTCIMISIISERMRQSNILAKEAEAKAKAANEAKGAFLSNMSHELRTPLNAILGYSQLMQRDSSLSKENINNLTIINKSGEHLLSLINDILEITKIESKKSSLNCASFDFQEMVKDVVEMLRLKTEAKNISFNIFGVDKIPRYLIGDSLKLRMVLINLIGNAIKFTDTGYISLTFDYFNKSENEFQLYVEIEDTGKGISENEIGKLFKFFSQTESGISSQAGTGLGLAISQEYVRLMGGKIDVLSNINIGSKFYFDIKMQIGLEDYVIEKDNSKMVIGLKNLKPIPKVLVVEDIKESREMLVKLLEKTDFKVYSAENGKQAIEKFEINRPDFIWMDIRMPVMDGMEATKQIKALPSGNKTKIVALSAHVFDEEKEAILAIGFDDFLGKPFSENDIFSIMAKHLDLEYIYVDQMASDGDDENDTFEKHIEDVAKVDIIKIRKIYEAIILLDDKKIDEAIKEIEIEAPKLSKQLREEVSKMNYTKILRLVEGGMK